jgi:hypothetical protein
MTTPAEAYRQRHPDRVAESQKKIEAQTIKRASVRFLKGRDDDLLKWLEATYGGSGGPEILKALGDFKSDYTTARC